MRGRRCITSLLILFCWTASASQDSLVPVTFTYPDGKVSSEGFLRAGKPDGYWRNYDREGRLVSEGLRKDYILEGPWKFYQGDTLVSQIQYHQGLKEGLSIAYLSDQTIHTPYQADLKHGLEYAFYPNGYVRRMTPFEKGIEHGMEYQFSADSVPVQSIQYRKGFIVERQRFNRRDARGMRQGHWKFFFPQTWMVSLEGPYVDDQRHGYFKQYDTLGQLSMVWHYIHDELQEDQEPLSNVEVRTEYYENGKPKLSVGYRDGQPDGVCREYNEQGELIGGRIFKEGKVVAKGIVDERGRNQDLWQEYYPDGRLKAQGKYRNGKRVGEWSYYYPEGQIEQKGQYDKQGQIQGEWVWYYPDGQAHIVQEFLEGKADGDYAEYDAQGELISKGQYIEGEREGDWFETVGDERFEGRYHYGERRGKWRHFNHLTGKDLSFEGSFVDGVPHGRHVYYQPNGKVLEEGSYSMGKRHGVWRKYDEQGQLYLRITYKNDDEIRYDHIRTTSHIKDY